MRKVIVLRMRVNEAETIINNHLELGYELVSVSPYLLRDTVNVLAVLKERAVDAVMRS